MPIMCLSLLFGLCTWALLGATESRLVYPGPDGRLVYQVTETGDRIPDFSWCGYGGGGVAIPDVAEHLALVPNAVGDDGARIQGALDRIAELPVGPTGFRGSLLLKRGIWRVAQSLTIRSGVVLRGEGQDADGTTLIATGTAVRALIQLREPRIPGARPAVSVQEILDERVSVGARCIQLGQPQRIRVGDEIVITRPSTADWIHAIGMDRIVPRRGDPHSIRQWSAGDYDMNFSRQVVAVDDHSITVDAPLVMAFERAFGGGTVAGMPPGSACRNAGVERLRLISDYRRGAETADEAHANVGVEIGPARDVFVREVTARHFVQGCVVIQRGARRITIQDSAAIDPVSQIMGGRRYAFFIDGGEQVLVQRCYSRNGRHDFVTGAKVPGPSAFVDCLAELSHDDSGPHHRWAVGLLYDHVTCKELHVQDRGSLGSGHGWAGANHVFWNCTAAIVCQQPPTAQNWAIGCRGGRGKPRQERAQGVWDCWGTPVSPRSLYQAQLGDRLGSAAVAAVTTSQQRTSAITEVLTQRYAAEPGYAPPSTLAIGR